MKKLRMRTRKILLAVYFFVGFLLTFLLSFERLQEYRLFFMLLFFAAATVDILFLVTLNQILKKTLYPVLAEGMKKMASALARRVGRLVGKISGKFSDGNKVFLDGKNERKFVFEIYSNKSQKNHRKMPKLPKNADEKQKIRHEYVAYVFKKDKDIPSTLTPSEVEKRLDETGEDHLIFARYNDARYDK